MADPAFTQLCPWLGEPFERLDRARALGHFGHAWLLAGPKGIGKGNLARVLATRLLDPERPPPGPMTAEAARESLQISREPADHDPDLHFLCPPLDKKSISVEQVREIVAELELTSLRGLAKALIVEPAEAMTLSAANALLKTLEEPTPSTYFLLVSHQPGFLPATVRSRCQTVSLRQPSPDQALAWLGQGIEDARGAQLEALLGLAGGAPLKALAMLDNDFININNELEDIFKQISLNQIDPLEVADRWLKGEPEVYLDWLAVRLERAIKARLAPEVSTSVTDRGDAALHNAWRDLTLKSLFERLGDTRALLGQLGGGINAELALRVLLLGFRAGREQT